VDDYFDEYNDTDSEGNDLLTLSDQEAWEDAQAEMRDGWGDPDDPEDDIDPDYPYDVDDDDGCAGDDAYPTEEYYW
jgi:hypothetical protein